MLRSGATGELFAETAAEAVDMRRQRGHGSPRQTGPGDHIGMVTAYGEVMARRRAEGRPQAEELARRLEYARLARDEP